MANVKMHLSLNVTNVELSTRWYEVFFGVSAHKRQPGYANFDLQNPSLKLALEQRPNPTLGQLRVVESGGMPDLAATQGAALNHLGLLVPDATYVNATKERLEMAGLITFSEENVECCYALQDKIWVRDPDGNAWEVYALLDDHVEVAPSCQPAAT